MNIDKLVFRGPADANADWQGKIEKFNGETSLVLFQRNDENGALKKLGSKVGNKLDGVHKAEKMIAEAFNNQSIVLLGQGINHSYLSKLLNSTIQTKRTVSQVFAALDSMKTGPFSLEINAKMTDRTDTTISKPVIISRES